MAGRDSSRRTVHRVTRRNSPTRDSRRAVETQTECSTRDSRTVVAVPIEHRTAAHGPWPTGASGEPQSSTELLSRALAVARSGWCCLLCSFVLGAWLFRIFVRGNIEQRKSQLTRHSETQSPGENTIILDILPNFMNSEITSPVGKSRPRPMYGCMPMRRTSRSSLRRGPSAKPILVLVLLLMCVVL